MEPLTFIDGNNNLESKPEVEGIVKLQFLPRKDPPATRVVRELPPHQELAKRMYLETLDLVGIPNKGSSIPKPNFLEDIEFCAVIQHVIWEIRISSENDLIILLNRSISPDPLSPISRGTKASYLTHCAMML